MGSLPSEGVLGVRLNGDWGNLKLPVVFTEPGRARPACSLCSSVHASSAAMSCKTWNFFGSDRSIARNCKKWLVTICLSTISSGFRCFRKRNAFVRWSLRITASCRSLPISRFFSRTCSSNGVARSSSLRVFSSSVRAVVDTSSALCTCFLSSSSCDCELSTSSRSSFFRASCCVSQGTL